MTIYRMYHAKAGVDRLYLPRGEGGRGLIQMELPYKVVAAGLETFLRKSKDEMTKFALEHERIRKLYSAILRGC